MTEPFTCAGCGEAQSAPSFDWTSIRTGKLSRYCFTCDDLLIQDQPLPLAEARAKLKSALANRGRKPIGARAMTNRERSARRYAKKKATERKAAY